MRGGEPDPFDPIYPVDAFKKPREIDLPFQPFSITVHVLSEKTDFFHSPLSQGLHLFDDLRTGTAPLPSPHVGHDAEGAEPIASLHDGNVGFHLLSDIPGQ